MYTAVKTLDFGNVQPSLAGKTIDHRPRKKVCRVQKKFAEDWFFNLRDQDRQGLIKNEKTFKQVAVRFEHEYEVSTKGERSPKWVDGHKARLRLHLVPFFGDKGLSEITAGMVQDYRIHRMESAKKPPARSTLHDEIVTLRQVLKVAIRYGWLDHLPDMSQPYGAQCKVVHRPWFSKAQYEKLYNATRKNVSKQKNSRRKRFAADLHDMVLFAANTGLRLDELFNLEHRDIEIVEDGDTDETILVIEVRGKRGVGYCKSTNGAVRPYERVCARHDYEGTDKVFPHNHLRMFNRILDEEKLKLDRDGQKRTLYSLRHTYICLRLMEGADVYQIAKNCRTSVEMIEKHYAAHIKNRIDAAAINVRKKKKKPKGLSGKKDATADYLRRPALAQAAGPKKYKCHAHLPTLTDKANKPQK